ncbi:MAG: hypothetical protein R2774_14870 [Saprospiraceae bacterium]
MTATASDGCTATAATTVEENRTHPAAASDNIGGPLTCIDNAVTIRAFLSTNYTYAWSGPNGYIYCRTNVVSTLGNYIVTVTDTNNGCASTTATAVLPFHQYPTASAGTNQTICNGSSASLTATGNSTCVWRI